MVVAADIGRWQGGNTAAAARTSEHHSATSVPSSTHLTAIAQRSGYRQSIAEVPEAPPGPDKLHIARPATTVPPLDVGCHCPMVWGCVCDASFAYQTSVMSEKF